MSTHKNFDKICVAVMIAAVILTLLFMNGESLGITKMVDADAETNEDNQYFTQNDLNADWDTDLASVIILDGDNGSIKGDGAYFLDGDLVIVESGYYMISGELTNGSIIVDSEENAKIWIMLNGVNINADDDAGFRIEEADKVFLTLAEGSENTITSGSEYSEEALDDGTDGAIYAHDDLTINGSGSLNIKAEYKHGIAAHDDLVITGGNISIEAVSDGINVNDSFNMQEASITITAGDDGIHSDDSIYIASGTVDITESYEGIEAYEINIAGGDITVNCTDDGLNANGETSGFGNFGNIFGGQSFGGGQNHGGHGGFNQETAEASDTSEKSSDTDDTSAESADTSETTVDSADTGKASVENADTAGHSMEKPDMKNASTENTDTSVESAETGDTSVESAETGDTSVESAETEDTSAENPGTMTKPSNMSDNFDKDSFTKDASSDSTSDSSVSDADSSDKENPDESSDDSSQEETTIPTVNISGGKLTIINTTGNDADGIDSNGDIIISGGEVYINLTGNGANCALDYGSENGGACTINGGIVVAAGGSSMLEDMSDDSEQVSIMYTGSSVSEGTTVTLTDENNNTLIEYQVSVPFTAVTLSCPQLQVGSTYTLTMGDTSEEIEITEVAGSYGSSTGNSMMGGGNMGGMGQQNGQNPMQPGSDSSDSSSSSDDDSANDSSSDSNMPQMPGGETPDMSDFDPSQIESGDIPQMPNGETPDMSDFDPSQMQNGQMPDGSDFDPSQMENGQMPQQSQTSDSSSQSDDSSSDNS